MGKHLNLSQRIEIEQKLNEGESFRQIANIIGKPHTTISREIQTRKVFQKGNLDLCCYYITLEKIRNLYAKINGIIDLPIMKIEKIYKDNNFAEKYISSSTHHLPNQDFINLYLQCIKIGDKNAMLDNIKKLYSYSFKQLDFNPENFCLKFIKKPPFRV